jgi:hypothetical protein
MWNWLNCYLSGRHDYGVTCGTGSIYLRCIHCGKRSEGWAVHVQDAVALAPSARVVSRPTVAKASPSLAFAARGDVQQQSA